MKHPYWLPLPVSETTELYCKDCGTRILNERLATGEILWEYVSLDNPEQDLIELGLSSQYGCPVEVESIEDVFCEECGTRLNVAVLDEELNR